MPKDGEVLQTCRTMNEIFELLSFKVDRIRNERKGNSIIPYYDDQKQVGEVKYNGYKLGGESKEFWIWVSTENEYDMEIDFTGNGPMGHATNRVPGINIVGTRSVKEGEGQLVGGLYTLYIKTEKEYCLQIGIERDVENDERECISYWIDTGEIRAYNSKGGQILDEIYALIVGLDETYGFKDECDIISNFSDWTKHIERGNQGTSKIGRDELEQLYYAASQAGGIPQDLKDFLKKVNYGIKGQVR